MSPKFINLQDLEIEQLTKEIERLKAEVERLCKQCEEWAERKHPDYDMQAKNSELILQLSESEAVVKVLACTIVGLRGEWMKYWIDKAKQEVAKRTKASVTKNNADLRRRKEAYGQSHICYCGVSVGSCQCPKEES